METPNTGSLSSRFGLLGMQKQDIIRKFRTMYGWSEPFRKESEAYEKV